MKFNTTKYLIAALAFMFVVLSFVGTQRVISPTAEASGLVETRCGWFSNPTPANAWLNDRNGEWLVAEQGGYQAEGDWPDFSDDRWVKTNGNYGYGCVCMNVTVNHRSHRIIKISKAWSRPLSTCRKDPALKRR